MAKDSKLKIAYHIKHEEGKEKAFFNRIGRAFVNRDGSMNLFLDYVPVGLGPNDAINIRDYEPKEKKEAESFNE